MVTGMGLPTGISGPACANVEWAAALIRVARLEAKRYLSAAVEAIGGEYVPCRFAPLSGAFRR